MRCTISFAAALIAAGLAIVPTTYLSAGDNTPAGDRQVVAKVIRDALLNVRR